MAWGSLAVRGLVLAAMTVGTSSPTLARRHRSKPGTELTMKQLGWPATTRSLRAAAVAKVYRVAGHSERWGKLAASTRVAWKRVLVVRDPCRTWVEIEPRGWVCATELVPSDEPPLAEPSIDPAAIVARVLALPYIAVVPGGTHAYKSSDAALHRRAGKKLGGWSFLRLPLGTRTIGGHPYVRTRHGYVSVASTMPRPASSFDGIDIEQHPPRAWPFAWVHAPPGEEITVRAAPYAKSPRVRGLARRDVVPIYEFRDGFARIGPAEWVANQDLRIARWTRRPDGVREDESWIDVDLDQQTLIAYEGDAPVYATLISSGKARSTPTAIHRIRKKHALTRLQSPSVALGRWDMPDVPFSMTFRKYYALHAAYWHDGFGDERSQGCVNLAPKDAQWLFGWTLPHVPAGWIEGSAYHDEGTPIRLRDRRDPRPAWTEHDVPPPPTVKLREAVADSN